jgi:hypothetical protein
MEVHLVDPVAVAIVRAQRRGTGVGVDCPLLRLGRARQPAEFGEVDDRVFRTGSRDRLNQTVIGCERVVARKWGCLVEHLVSFRRHARYGRALCR